MHNCLKVILFWSDNVHVLDGHFVHHQEFKTVHTATGICQTDIAGCLPAQWRIWLVFLYKYIKIHNHPRGLVIRVSDS